MIVGLTSEQAEAANLFFPYAMGEVERVAREGKRFVHYTTADVAKSVLERREIWMRNASTMNDFSEITYGLNTLQDCLYSEPGNRLRAILESVHPGLMDEFLGRLRQHVDIFRTQTYLTCVSEHEGDEDIYGRLSMWRAYGGAAGVALVMHNAAFLTPTDVLRVYTSPVLYADQGTFDRRFSEVVSALARRSDVLRMLGRELLLEYLFNACRFAILCTKHPGFREEREWRIIHTPPLDHSPHLGMGLESVRAVPQRVLKLPLRDHPGDGLIGLAPNLLIDRIIIGPTEHPAVLREAFIDLLAGAGVRNPAAKVVNSNIPLRDTR